MGRALWPKAVGAVPFEKLVTPRVMGNVTVAAVAPCVAAAGHPLPRRHDRTLLTKSNNSVLNDSTSVPVGAKGHLHCDRTEIRIAI